MEKKPPERGAASMIIELRDSKITVIHGTDKVVLIDGPVVEGAWDSIWDAIYTVIEEGVNNG